MKFTLLWIQGDTGLLASLEEVLNRGDMFFKGCVVDVTIIDIPNKVVDQFWFLVNVVIYKSLKDGRCVHETKHHNIELEGAFWSIECGEPFLAFFDT